VVQTDKPLFSCLTLITARESPPNLACSLSDESLTAALLKTTHFTGRFLLFRTNLYNVDVQVMTSHGN